MTAPQSKLPPGQVVHPDHPRFGLPWFAHRAPRELGPLSIELVGPDGLRGVLDEAALAGLARREQRSDLHCVTTWSRLGLDWAGVSFQQVYDEVIRPRVDPDGSAMYLTFHGLDGFRDESLLEDLLVDDVLLADSLYGRPLTVRYGGPVRLVAPAHYGFKNVKHLSRIELRRATGRPVKWWTSHHPRARVAYEERIMGLPDRPTGLLFRRYLLKPTLWWYRRHKRD